MFAKKGKKLPKETATTKAKTVYNACVKQSISSVDSPSYEVMRQGKRSLKLQKKTKTAKVDAVFVDAGGDRKKGNQASVLLRGRKPQNYRE